MTRNDTPMTTNDQSQELERVLELIEAVDAARATFQAKQRQIEAWPFEAMTVSMTPEEYALQHTLHAAETRIEKLGLDTARKYAGALAELERLAADRDAYRAALTLYANLQVNYRRVITFQMLDEVWESASKATDKYGCADCHGQTFEDGMVCCWTCGREMPQAADQ